MYDLLGDLLPSEYFSPDIHEAPLMPEKISWNINCHELTINSLSGLFWTDDYAVLSLIVHKRP